MSFFKKKDQDEENVAAEPVVDAPPPEGDPDPSTWAIPPDSAVTAPDPDAEKTAETVVRPIPEKPVAEEPAEEPAAVAATQAAIPVVQPEDVKAPGGAQETAVHPTPSLEKADPPAAEPEPEPEPVAAAPEPEPEPVREPVVSAATITSPGVGSGDEPRAAAAASAGARATERPSDRPPLDTAAQKAQDKPELLVAGAFVGAFLFAKILKKIAD